MGIKKLLKRFYFIDDYLRRKRLSNWARIGLPDPPPQDIKQLAILYYGIVFKLKTLIETGTCLGDMVWAQKDFFDQIFSIELSKELYEQAQERFRRYPHIKIVHGDSSTKLGEVLQKVKSPSLIFLDGHYSGDNTAKGEIECPVLGELAHVFSSPVPHFVFIDDARLFNGTNDYPTMSELSSFIESNSNYRMRTEGDFIILQGPTFP